MSITFNFSMEAMIDMMGDLMDKYGIRQNVCARLDRNIEELEPDKEQLREKLKEYNAKLREGVKEKLEQNIVDNTTQLVETNKCIDALEFKEQKAEGSKELKDSEMCIRDRLGTRWYRFMQV